MMSKEQGEALRAGRVQIGKEILLAMKAAEDLPLPNVYRLGSVMQEYYKEGYRDDLRENGSRWNPSWKTWRNSLGDIVIELQKDKQFFRFKRNGFECIGWQFCTKKEEHNGLIREQTEERTRIDRINERNGDAHKKWPALEVPAIEPIGELPAYKH